MTAATTPTVAKIRQTIKKITTISDNHRVEVHKVNSINASLQGYKIVQGFSGIITSLLQASTMLSESKEINAEPLADEDAKFVVQSLTIFIRVHQTLLNVVIGKHGIPTLVPSYESIHQALVCFGVAIDTFATSLIALLPTQKPIADKQFSSLRATAGFAQDAYSGAV